MPLSAVWWFLAGPLVLAGTALLSTSKTLPPQRAAKHTVLAASFNLLTAVIAALAVGIAGTLQTGTAGYAGLGCALYLDRLTIVMFALVSSVGLAVVAYSRNYLDGDPGQRRFLRSLCLTLAAVLTLILSGNLAQFAAAWITTSLCLHRLLTFYRDRPAGLLAARKKFVVSRCSDLCLIAGAALLYRTCGSLDYAALASAAHKFAAAGPVPAPVNAAMILFGASALLKSAQFPLHGWLIEVMETPTPVSALLHAGIINAGGFLVLRFADLVVLSPSSLHLLAIAGALTALFGSLAMLTQTSIKVSLAYSTIGQMGFMMLECGLGAFPAALLHIVGHSLYKAHAFLTSGSVVDIARASWVPLPGREAHPVRQTLIVAGLLLMAFAVSEVFGTGLAEQPGIFALGAILAMSLSLLLTNALDERPNLFVILRTLGLGAAVLGSYFALQVVVKLGLAGSFPPDHVRHSMSDILIASGVVTSFGAVTILQSLLPSLADMPRWQALYVHFANGLYVNTIANRLIVRFWPASETRSDRIVNPANGRA